MSLGTRGGGSGGKDEEAEASEGPAGVFEAFHPIMSATVGGGLAALWPCTRLRLATRSRPIIGGKIDRLVAEIGIAEASP